MRRSVQMDTRQIMDTTTGANMQEEGLPLLSPQELMQIPKGKCIILAGGLAAKPIYASLPFAMSKAEYEERINSMPY